MSLPKHNMLLLSYEDVRDRSFLIPWVLGGGGGGEDGGFRAKQGEI